MNDYKIDIVRTGRVTIAIEIINSEKIKVHAPKNMSDGEIKQFIQSKSKWIQKHLDLIGLRESELNLITIPEDIYDLKHAATIDLTERTLRFAEQLGVSYKQITIRCQKKRWGSCSSKANLNYNCVLMLCPPKVRDYVVVHELCHLIEFNHSRRFWANVERVMPDYKMQRQWLKTNGEVLISLSANPLLNNK